MNVLLIEDDDGFRATLALALRRRGCAVLQAAGKHEALGHVESGSIDAIVLDAYHASEIPEHLTTPAFFAEVRRRLTRHGLCLANVYVKSDADDAARRIAATMAEEWPALRVLDTPGALERNTILIAGSKEIGRAHV